MTTYRRGAGAGLAALFRGRQFNRGAAWGMMIIGALLAFEIFNFSTTQFALRDVLGDLTFAGFRWATILAIALLQGSALWRIWNYKDCHGRKNQPGSFSCCCY